MTTRDAHPSFPAAPRVLVTGGAGFIGSALVRLLVSNGAQAVLVYDALTYAATAPQPSDTPDDPGVQLVVADVRDGPALTRALEVLEPNIVFHLAAETHVDRSIDGPRSFIDTNVLGTATLLDRTYRYWLELPGSARTTFRFVHVSTDEVFGSAERDTFTESTPYDPSSPYAATKAAADHLVRAWHRTYGFPALVTNCSNNFGPYQFPDKLIPHIIASALERREVPIYGDGRQVRDWIHVDDHVHGLWAVATRGRVGETYLLGARVQRTNSQVAHQICRLLDERRPLPDATSYADLISHVEDRPGHDRRYAIEPAKSEAELQWAPRRDFDEALEETVGWYLDNEAWWKEIRSQQYPGQRLGMLP